MAKIENTKIYPTVTPSMEDLLIATDVSNKNETVTFLVSSLIGGTGVLQGLQSVLDTVNTATQNINLTGNITVIGTVAPVTITAVGSTGLAGQILSSTATGIEWIDSPSTSCCTWNDSLLSGPIATTKAIIDGVLLEVTNAGGGINIFNPATLNNSGISTFDGQVNINSTILNFNSTGQINDGAGNTGTPGQWLTVDVAGTGLEWSSTIPPSSCCDLQSTLNIGSTSFNQGMLFSGTSSITMGTNVSIGSQGNNVWSGNNRFSGTLEVDACLEDSLSSCGLAGQVLMSTGSAVEWSTGAGLGAQDLQGVLDTGNSATGANADITISGTINPGTITDSSGGTGAVGQVLTISGSGLSWATSVAAPVTSVSPLPEQASSGNAITITPTTGLVTVQPNYFAGAANIGHVPSSVASPQTTTFLRADGTWNVPAGGGGAVTDLNIGMVVSSTGEPIEISPVSPATGSVTINQTRYAGGINEGCVPRGSGGFATVYLDGSGGWSVPAATPLNSFVGEFKIFSIKLIPNPVSGNTYNTFTEITHGTFGQFDPMRLLKNLGTVAPSTGWTVIDQFGGYLFGNGANEGCTTADDELIICGGQSQFQANETGQFYFELWKGDVCAGTPPTPVKAAELFIDYGSAGSVVCVDWVMSSIAADITLSGSEFMFITLRSPNVAVGVELSVICTNSFQNQLL